MLRKILLSLGVVLVVGIPVLILVVRAFPPGTPPGLGVNEGRLAACPPTPNCVTTQSGNADQLMPAISYTITQEEAATRLLQIVNGMDRTQIITSRPDYIHATFRSLVWGFVDDIEFFIDPDAKLIHFRAAARLGRSDAGVNRARMEEISQAFSRAR